MSRLRAGTCQEPGPGDLHCTEPRRHLYSCYDAGEDVSWNQGTWDPDADPHACEEPTCQAAEETPHA